MKSLSRDEMRAIAGGNPPMCQVHCQFPASTWCGCYGQGTCGMDPYGTNSIVCNCEGTVTQLPCGIES